MGGLLALAVVLVYANTLQAPFVFDDRGAVVENPTIRTLWAWPGAFAPPPDGSTTTGRPFLNFTFALNYAISGLDVWSYHLVNLLIHGAAALTLWSLARRTLARLYPTTSDWPAFFIALLWAVHPLLSESVTCVAQRTESLCGLFLLLTLAGFERGTTTTGSPWPAWSLSLGAALLGMATKEVMATAPLLVLLFDRTFVAGTFGAAWRSRRRYYGLLALAWLPLLGLVFAGGGTRGTSAGLGLGVSPWEYLLTQTHALVIYLKLSVWPHHLIVDYGTAVVRSLAEAWLPGLAILGLLAATIWALARRPMAGFLGAWFFILLAPSSSVIPLLTQTIAEHRMYLPLLSIVVALVAIAYRVSPRAAPFVLAGIALAFGGRTIARNHDYRSEPALWAATIAQLPSNPRPHANLGIALQRQGAPADSLAHFQRALALDPIYVTALHGLGTSLLQLNRPDEALVPLQTAVSVAPNHADAQLALGNALVQTGRAAEALAAFAHSLRIHPAADAHYNLAFALLQLGRTADARTELEAALRLAPDLAPARALLVQSLSTEAMRAARAGQFALAEKSFAQLVKLEPAHAEHRANLGNTLLMQRRPLEAIAHYEAALRLVPDDARTRENLALARQQVGK